MRRWVETITIEEEHTGALTAFLLPFLFLPPRPRGAVPWSLGKVCTPGGWRPGRRAGIGTAAAGGRGCGPLPHSSSLPAPDPRPSSSPSSPSSSRSLAAAVRGAACGTGAAQPLSLAAERARAQRRVSDGGRGRAAGGSVGRALARVLP